jgi:hypothetical protein
MMLLPASSPPFHRPTALRRTCFSLLLLALFAGCTPATPGRVVCQPSDGPADAVEHKAMADVHRRVGCDEPGSSCSFQIVRTADKGVLIHAAFFQVEEDSGQCFMAGDAVAEYLYSAEGEYLREAHGGLSALHPAQPHDSPQPASAD